MERDHFQVDDDDGGDLNSIQATNLLCDIKGGDAFVVEHKTTRLNGREYKTSCLIHKMTSPTIFMCVTWWSFDCQCLRRVQCNDCVDCGPPRYLLEFLKKIPHPTELIYFLLHLLPRYRILSHRNLTLFNLVNLNDIR